MDPTKTRGFLNNNPGNIDRLPPPLWNGEIRDPADPRLNDMQRWELARGRFCVFDTAHHGIRALAKNLLADHDRLGDRTVRQFIGHWAPPLENNTTAYIANVCTAANCGPDDPIDIRSRPVICALVSGIIRVECGGMPYALDQIQAALTDAGIA